MRQDVSLLLQSEVSEDLIRAKLDQDGCLCDTSAQSIIDLKAAGATDELVVELIRHQTEPEPEP